MSFYKKMLVMGVVLLVTTTISFAFSAEYRFEKCDGTATLENYASSELVASLSGDANISVDGGRIKNALILSGDGMMSVEHNSKLDLVDNLTISFWVKPAEIKQQALVTRGLGTGACRKYASNAEYFIKMQDSGQLAYRHSFVESNGEVLAYSDTNLSVNVWTHVVLTRDNSSKTIRFYINGVANTQYTYTTEPDSSNSEKLIFGYCDGCINPSRFSGKLDEIKIYDIAMTQDEIADLYDTEKEGGYSTGGCHPAPLLVNDNADLPFSGAITVDVLANDRTNDSETCFVDNSTVMIRSNPVDSNRSDDNKTLIVEGEGNWSVESNGSISFISESSFVGNPTDINYTVSDSCANLSNQAVVSLTRVAPLPTPTPTPTPTPNPTSIPTSTSVVTPSTPSSIPITPHTETVVPNPIDTTISSEDKNITIGDFVWYDKDRDGIQDSSEYGVKNVTVVLFDTDGNVIDRTLTNSSGIYHLSAPIGSYTIGFSDLPSNYSFTSQNIGSSDAKDSDVDSSGRTGEFTVGSVENNLIYDAGIVLLGVDNNITIHSSVDDNASTTIEDCKCNKYKKNIPSLNLIGLVAIWLLVSLLGVLFLRGDELDFTKK